MTFKKGTKLEKEARQQANLHYAPSAGEYLTFVAAQSQGSVEVVYADEDIWLTQIMIGVLYDMPPTIN